MKIAQHIIAALYIYIYIPFYNNNIYILSNDIYVYTSFIIICILSNDIYAYIYNYLIILIIYICIYIYICILIYIYILFYNNNHIYICII